MGKKKSKTAKKKQQAASRKFGVQVKKGNGGRERPEKVVLNATPSKQKQRGGRKQQQQSRKSLSRKIQHTSNKGNEEHADFARQMTSAQERQSARESRKKLSTTKRQQHSFQPATLIIDDKLKSTSRLLQETTSQIRQSFHGLVGDQNTTSSAAPGQSSLSLAAGGSTAWSADTNTNEPSVLECDNPYAALGGDDDDSDDDEQQHAQPPPTLPLFRLAPASFAVGGNNDADVDPDL